jgi:hypothetical protein
MPKTRRGSQVKSRNVPVLVQGNKRGRGNVSVTQAKSKKSRELSNLEENFAIGDSKVDNDNTTDEFPILSTPVKDAEKNIFENVFETPENRENQIDPSWRETVEYISKNPYASSKFVGLVKVLASVLDVGNVIFWYDPTWKHFQLFQVRSLKNNMVNVENICKNMMATSSSCKLAHLPDLCSFPLTYEVYVCSSESIYRLRSDYSSVIGCSWNDIKTTWFQSTNIAASTINEMNSSIDLTNESYDRLGTVASKATLSSTNSSGIPVESNAIVKAISDLTDDKITGKVTLKKKGLTLPAAALMSADPEQILKKGTLQTYYALCHMNATDCDCSEISVFWGIEKWLIQMQPPQLMKFASSWREISFETFASLSDKYGTEQANKKFHQFFHSDDKIKDIQIDINIIGNELSYFERAMMIFAMTIDSVFQFKKTIKTAVKQAAQRCITFTRQTQPGKTSNASGLLFLYIGTEFQIDLDNVFCRVLCNNLNSEQTIVEALGLIPDYYFSSNCDRYRYIQNLLLKHTVERDNSSVAKFDNITKKKNSHKKKTNQQQTSEPNQAIVAAKICAFNLTVKGCQYKTGCKRLHKEPTTDAEIQDVKQSFKLLTKLVPLPKFAHLKDE